MSLDHRELPKVTSSRFQPQFLPIGMPQELSPQIPMAMRKGAIGLRKGDTTKLQQSGGKMLQVFA